MLRQWWFYDNEDPVMNIVSKMAPTSDKGRLYSFGIIFSGKKTRFKVRILGPNYFKGKKIDIHTKTVQRVALMMGRKA